MLSRLSFDFSMGPKKWHSSAGMGNDDYYKQ